MKLGPYQLLAQVGAGKDGVAFEAISEASGDVGIDTVVQRTAEAWLLTGARADEVRWRELRRDLKLAALLDHPNIRRVIRLGLDEEPPFALVERRSQVTLDDRCRVHGRPGVEESIRTVAQLADGLRAAHRIGLPHRRLRPSAILYDYRLIPQIDLFTVDCQAAVGEITADGNRDESGFNPPDDFHGDSLDSAADIYSLGAILLWLLTDAAPPPKGVNADTLSGSVDFAVAEPLAELLRQMFAREPTDRPTAREVAEHLDGVVRLLPAIVSVTADAPQADDEVSQTMIQPAMPIIIPPSIDLASGKDRLGRFRILEKLGEGAMGAVYRAEDVTDGSVVAVKVLGQRVANNPRTRRRFLKEARLLSEVNNQNVANLREVNEDNGVFYLAIEFVPGRSVDKLLAERGKLTESLALAVMADVARALVDAHQRGIVHRDIKPANILLIEANLEQTGGPVAKLSDFGLARHVEQSESLDMTGAGGFLGTPLYMSPEQGQGRPTDPRSDVYSMGATLYHLIAGKAPFNSDNVMQLVTMHCVETPPPLQTHIPDVNESTARIVAKALAKKPEDRYSDAGALLRDLERVRRGEPSDIVLHPAAPSADPKHIVSVDFEWDLEAKPEQLWPHVSNTERLNRAIGLSAVEFSTKKDAALGIRRFAKAKIGGFPLAWEEHPFEWIEGRRMGVLREFSQGPHRWFVSVVELHSRPTGGARLRHSIRMASDYWLIRKLGRWQLEKNARKSLDAVYRRIDNVVLHSTDPAADPFEPPKPLSASKQQRLDQLIDRMVLLGEPNDVLEKLSSFIATAPDQEISRIRPIALARRYGLDARKFVATCIRAAREGLLVLMWDILCPLCRIPSEVVRSLAELSDHGHCEACDINFALDFANSVEMILRVHPQIRDAETKTFCIGGPGHSPHVVAQVRLAAGERMDLGLSLDEGAYRLRCAQLGVASDFRVRPDGAARYWEWSIARTPQPLDALPIFRAGNQNIAIANEQDRELLVRIERRVQRDDAMTAAGASTLAIFREMFPQEILAPGRLAGVGSMTFLLVRVEHVEDLYERLGDARTISRLQEVFHAVESKAAEGGGAVVKTDGPVLTATFRLPEAAVAVAFGLRDAIRSVPECADIEISVALHCGPAVATTSGQRLDYLGAAVQAVHRMLASATSGMIVVSQSVAGDPEVAKTLRELGGEGKVVELELWKNRREMTLHFY